ncbi:retrovirus-related pol polyprotein from transposon TNT 1-94, partial [Tanacetum coccineum]
MVIKKLKKRIKSLSGNMDKDKIKQDLEEIETINIELDHKVTKLIAENEHLKQTYNQLYDSIKPARKSFGNYNSQDELRKHKGKDLANKEVTHHPSDPEINTEPITPKLLNKRSAHSAYIKHTQEEAAVFRDLVDHIKANYPLDPTLESASRHGLVRGKSKKKPHKPKSEDTNQEKLYLLHMDLCGPMCVANVNGKKYILVIVDDYSRFTWVKFLRSKDEAPNFIIKFLKMIQLRLKVHVRRIRTDNGTTFVNQTLCEYYEKVGISHEISVARSPHQNGVVERQNHTLIEAARTMLIYAKA